MKYAAESGCQQGQSTKMACCPTTNPLEDHPDYQVASFKIDVLSKEHEQPCLLAAGIVKPHLAFVCPQEFFDLHAASIMPPFIRPNDRWRYMRYFDGGEELYDHSVDPQEWNNSSKPARRAGSFCVGAEIASSNR